MAVPIGSGAAGRRTAGVATRLFAGAHLALWGAGRTLLSAASPIRGENPLPVHAGVAIDGPVDISDFVGPDVRVCGKHFDVIGPGREAFIAVLALLRQAIEIP